MVSISNIYKVSFIGFLLFLLSCKTSKLPNYNYLETNSGLKYAEIKKGNGISPRVGDIVVFHYTGKLENGNIFERSRDRNAPISIRIGSNQFIDGLSEGILLMKVGDHFSFVVPPHLGYGNIAVGIIPPNSTLFYEVELIDVKRGVDVSKAKKEEFEKITTASGLTYAITHKGKGQKAFEGLLIKADYTGFYNGNRIFDSSVESGKPLEAKLGDKTLITGLEEGFTYLHEGDKARFWIPASLAYGSEGRGLIPPNTDLVFDVELKEVNQPPLVIPFFVGLKDTLETGLGLRYIIVEKGQGNYIQPGQIVKIHYSAFLKNGYMFDSSVERNQPFTMVAGQGLFIPGLDDAVLLMKEGAKYRFIIPSYLGFGKRSFGNIPSHSDLIFDIEIIDIINND